mmetsp:Transcript_28445/g.71554  ORF Transcript_28445/g.71554 Transcript_28445/m.71554 type:complete len:208 (-) Transcript_28445:219-842(-)
MRLPYVFARFRGRVDRQLLLGKLCRLAQGLDENDGKVGPIRQLVGDALEKGRLARLGRPHAELGRVKCGAALPLHEVEDVLVGRGDVDALLEHHDLLVLRHVAHQDAPVPLPPREHCLGDLDRHHVLAPVGVLRHVLQAGRRLGGGFVDLGRVCVLPVGLVVEEAFAVHQADDRRGVHVHQLTLPYVEEGRVFGGEGLRPSRHALGA